MLNSAPRKGLTLLEVLITIFVMAIGFLSVLTLFPLAARKLARSIDSDRATLMAGNAEAALKLLNYPSIAAQQMDLFCPKILLKTTSTTGRNRSTLFMVLTPFLTAD